MSNLPACCMDLDIDVMDFIFPRRLNEDGFEFLRAHGLAGLTPAERDSFLAGADYRGAGVVKIKHRCAQLTDDGLCAVYATRPAICRAFDCTKRRDCACQGAGVITDVVLYA